MKLVALALAGCLALAACGVDGPPVAPDSPTPGISMGGEAYIGVRGAL